MTLDICSRFANRQLAEKLFKKNKSLQKMPAALRKLIVKKLFREKITKRQSTQDLPAHAEEDDDNIIHGLEKVLFP
jgi:hypothetical protein